MRGGRWRALLMALLGVAERPLFVASPEVDEDDHTGDAAYAHHSEVNA